MPVGVSIVIFINNNDRNVLPHDFAVTLGSGNLAVLAMPGKRPSIIGDIRFTTRAGHPTLVLDSLLWDGEITLDAAVNLSAFDCTIGRPRPDQDGFSTGIRLVAPPDPADVGAGTLAQPTLIQLGTCIVGPCAMSRGPVVLNLADSIVDAGGGTAIAGDDQPLVDNAGLRLNLDAVTVFGDIRVSAMLGCVNALLDGRVLVAGQAWHQAPPHSIITRPAGGDPLWLRWWSRRYAMPGYGLLDGGNPQTIMAAGTDMQTPGAFHRLYDRQRERNIQPILAELTMLGDRTRIAFTA